MGLGWYGRYYPSYYYSPYDYGRYEYYYGRYGQGAVYRSGDYQVRAASGTFRGADVHTLQVKGPYEQWGTSTVSRSGDWVQSRYRSNDQGTAARFETSRGGQGAVVKGDERQGGLIKAADNNVYVGRNGNVYRHDENGWTYRQDDQWTSFQPEKSLSSLSAEQLQSIQKEAAQRKSQGTQITTWPSSSQIKSSNTYQQLQQDRAARSRGNYRTNLYTSRRSTGALRSRPYRGGGRR